jgi:hypothetical protein
MAWSSWRGLSPPSTSRLLVGNLFANGGHLLLRRADVRATGGFRPGLAYGEDWEFWTRLALRGRFAATPGRPVLFVRRHPESAYQRLAAAPHAFVPCTEAIFANPDLPARFGPRRLAAIRRRTEAENQWIMRCSVRAHATPRRLALLAAAHALPLLPATWRGPFRAYSKSARRPQGGIRVPCVMAVLGLDPRISPAIHVLATSQRKDVDGRPEPILGRPFGPTRGPVMKIGGSRADGE